MQSLKLCCAGLESRKKWKESIKCAADENVSIWSHLQKVARANPETLTQRHVWVQWPLESAGPTMFLGQIVDFDPWTGMSTVLYYYKYTQVHAP